MTSISIIWDRLEPTVRQWLLENPGTIVLPRTMVNRVTNGSGEDLPVDEHGEYWFAPTDITFLKARRRAMDEDGSTPSALEAALRTDAHEEALDR